MSAMKDNNRESGSDRTLVSLILLHFVAPFVVAGAGVAGLVWVWETTRRAARTHSPSVSPVVVGWAIATALFLFLAIWSSINLRCPKGHGAMEVHERSSGGLGSLFDLAYTALGVGPRLQCRVCELRRPLPRLRHPIPYVLLAISCAGFLAFAIAGRHGLL